MEIFEALAATWPAAETREHAGWVLRRGAGGGNRVGAAVHVDAAAEIGEGEIGAAEAVMRGWGQVPLFMVRPGEAELDAALEARGYLLRDPTALLAAPASGLGDAVPGDAVVFCDAPLACMAALWNAGGIGAARRAVMDRVAAPKVWLLGRHDNRAMACGFAARHGRFAMLHALEVAAAARRNGLGARMSRAAASWAAQAGAATLALAVTRANAPALALYGGLGFAEVAGYHYRALPADE